MELGIAWMEVMKIQSIAVSPVVRMKFIAEIRRTAGDAYLKYRCVMGLGNGHFREVLKIIFSFKRDCADGSDENAVYC
ncbi:unnamed protein product, partial [Rotaria magnacalcarata]